MMGKDQWTAKPQSEAPVKPIQRRLLVPLSGVLLLLACSVGIGFMSMHQSNLQELNRQLLESALDELAEELAEQSDALAALGLVLIREPELHEALKAGDRERLLAAHETIFAQLRNEYAITHFYFHRPDRVNLLRMHKPEKHGDLIARFTAREAERTRAVASGIELGPLGTFTLRSVRPVMDGDTLIGYLEMGKEIEDILPVLHEEQGVETAVAIFKSALNRTQWEAGMAMLGREADWDRHPEKAIIYSSLDCIPSECDRFIEEAGHTHDEAVEVEFNDASWRVLISTLKDASGTHVGDLVIFNDITEEKAAFARVLAIVSAGSLVLLAGLFGFLFALLRRTDRGIRVQQAALIRSESFQKQILETVATAVFIVDSEQIIRSVNRKFCDLTGFSEAEIVGHHCDILCGDRRDARKKRAIREIVGHCDILCGNPCETICGLYNPERTEPIFHRQREIHSKDGRRLTIIKNAGLIRDEGGNITGGIESFIDVTELVEARELAEETNKKLKQAIAHANAMTANAEQANMAKGEFLANMSHEIRTPMNGVIGMAGLLLDTKLTDEQRQYANVVRASGESLLSLINDILDFSKIEAGRLELEILDFDLRITFEDISEVLAFKAHEKGLELTAFVHPDVPSLLRGDPGRLRQIIVNLASNAVKFTHKGEVTIRADLENESEQEALVRFAVTDTGIGIPSDRLEDMFSPFIQADGTTTRKYGGTGLGLSISKQLCEMMGGEIGVQSQEGKGSSFWFTARFKKPAEDGRMPFETAAEIRDVRMLVVDDHETNRLLVITLLHSWGCRGEEAADGAAALAQLKEGVGDGDPFRVALLDMQMPEMDGEELGRRIKADPQISDTVLIMMTSFGQRGDGGRLGKAGFAAYLCKPVQQAQLHDCLTLALGAKQDGKGNATGPALITRHTISEARKRRIRILLAEDSSINQLVALAILDKLGYRADAVANGKEALEALRTLPYDLVLMDCQMPEMDGYEATRKIRQGDIARNPEVPVIAMTAHAMRGDREKCLDAGMNDYIAKPVSPQIIAETLERWLAPQDETGDLTSETPATDEAKDLLETDDQIPEIFNREDLLIRVMGNENLAVRLIKIFLNDMPGQIMALKASVAQRLAGQAGVQAHKIKGTAGNVGSPALWEIASAMEKAGEAEDVEELDNLIPKLEKRFNQVKRAMEKGSDGLPEKRYNQIRRRP